MQILLVILFNSLNRGEGELSFVGSLLIYGNLKGKTALHFCNLCSRSQTEGRSVWVLTPFGLGANLL